MIKLTLVCLLLLAGCANGPTPQHHDVHEIDEPEHISCEGVVPGSVMNCIDDGRS